MILAVDFDDVLHDPRNRLPGKRLGEPLAGAQEAMQLLKRLGHTLIIHSVWGDKPEPMQEWLSFFRIPYDQITRLKPDADVYLDNRAVRFLSWQAFLDSGVIDIHTPVALAPPVVTVLPMKAGKVKPFKPLY